MPAQHLDQVDCDSSPWRVPQDEECTPLTDEELTALLFEQMANAALAPPPPPSEDAGEEAVCEHAACPACSDCEKIAAAETNACAVRAGARSRCRSAPPLIRFAPDSLTYSVCAILCF
jgi:hypothetical protein